MKTQIVNHGTISSVSHGQSEKARLSYEDAKNQYETTINEALSLIGESLDVKVKNVANGQITEFYHNGDLIQAYYLLSDRNGWVASWQSYAEVA